MKIRRILKPGQPGTKKLLEKYGENLVCVRYRYDSQRRRKLKTVELIIEEASWQPPPGKIPVDKIMHLRIAFEEVEIRNLVKQVGAKWNPREKVWQLPYKQVLKLGLTKRIVKEMGNNDAGQFGN